MNTLFTKKRHFFFFFFLVVKTSFSQVEVNVLDEDYYGFNVQTGNMGWWMQHPDNFSISSEQTNNASAGSLKYTNATSFTGNKRAFGRDISEMLINLEAGTHQLRLYVYLTSGSEFTNVMVDIREGSTTVHSEVIDISSIAKDTWVPVTVDMNVASSISNAQLRVIMHHSYGINGTMYIDDLAILKEVPELDKFASVTAASNNLLNVSNAGYDISLKVWVDNDCTIPNFYTQLQNPTRSINWDISGVNKEEWVTLTKTVASGTEIEDEDLKIIVNNNYKTTNYSGSFYIDDIQFSQEVLSDKIIVPNKFYITPNPARDFIELNLQTSAINKVVIYNTQGKLVKLLQGAKLFRIDISFLNSGIYYVKVFSDKGVFVQKLIVQ